MMNLGHSNSAEYDNHNAVCPQYLQYLSAGAKMAKGGSSKQHVVIVFGILAPMIMRMRLIMLMMRRTMMMRGGRFQQHVLHNHHHHHHHRHHHDHHHHRSQSSRCSTISENLAPSPFTSYSDHQAQHHLIHPALHSTTIEGKAQYIQYIQYYN